MSAINDWDNKILRLLIDREVGSVLRDLSMVFPNWIINILLNWVLQNIDPVEKMNFIPLTRNFMIVAGFEKKYVCMNIRVSSRL